MPVISVVMSVYNGARYVKFAIDSVLGQDEDFEFIIVDDGSNDDTWQVLDLYKANPLVKILRNRLNLGLSESLNRGISIAKGEYIVRQDADDLSCRGRIKRQRQFLDNNFSTGLLGTWYEVINEMDDVLERVTVPVSNDDLQKSLLCGNSFCHGSVIFRKTLFNEVGGYRFGHYPTQDYDLWLRMSEKSLVANIPDVLYQYRIGNGAISSRKLELQLQFDRLARDLAKIRRQNLLEPLDLCSMLNDVETDRLIVRKMWMARMWLVQRKIDEFLECIQETCLIAIKNSLEDFWTDSFIELLEVAYQKPDLLTTQRFLCQLKKSLPFRQIEGLFWGKWLFFKGHELTNADILKCFFKAIILAPGWLLNKAFLLLVVRLFYQNIFNVTNFRK